MCLPGVRSLRTIAVGALSLVSVIVSETHPAAADVTFVEELKVKGADGSTEMKRTVHLSGLKEREDSVTSFSPSLARETGTRREETTTITRIDRGLSWTLDPESKTDSQKSLDALEAEMRQKATRADSTAMTSEAPDASPEVTITPTSETKQIGQWMTRKTTVEVSTEVMDLPSGAKRKGTIVWDLWLADSLPGAAEMRAFNRIRAQKLGTPGEMEPLEAIGKSFTKSVKQAMLALREVHGYPVEWTWVIRTALSPEERAALAESAATQREGLDESDQTDHSGSGPMSGLKPVDPATVRSTGNEDLYHQGETSPGGSEAASADINVFAGEGSTVFMNVRSTLKSLTTASCDPSLFEIPSDYRNLSR
jgi:hypothetical protein